VVELMQNSFRQRPSLKSSALIKPLASTTFADFTAKKAPWRPRSYVVCTGSYHTIIADGGSDVDRRRIPIMS
jgi:hypothetical protein